MLLLNHQRMRRLMLPNALFVRITRKAKSNKEKEKYNKTTSIRNETPNIHEDLDCFTRSKTKSFMKDLCFFSANR